MLAACSLQQPSFSISLVVFASHTAVAQETGDQVDGQWEDDGRVLFRRYGVEGLKRECSFDIWSKERVKDEVALLRRTCK